MTRAGREIEFASDAAQVRAYLALPARASGPGVLVLQEWWGLVDHIRDVCDRLARAGFVALAPDLYRGATATDPDAAGRLMLDLELPRVEQDLDAAVSALLGETAVAGGTLGVVGFCMGGQLALLAGTRNRRIGAVVDCYGIHPRVTLDLAGLAAPVLGIFAERDAFVPPAAVRKLEAELRAAGKRSDFNIFPGVDHAFLNDTRADVYDAAAAERAWGMIASFLRAELVA
jgi:carboxymethylenebutenolidase